MAKRDPVFEGRRYVRRRTGLVTLLLGCVLLFAGGLSQADKVLVFDDPLRLSFARRDLLIVEERPGLGTSAPTGVRTTLRDLATSNEPLVRLHGHVVGAFTANDRLYLATDSGLSEYDESLVRLSHIPLPRPQPGQPTAVRALVAARWLDGAARLIGRGDRGLYAGTLVEGGMAFGAQPLALAVRELERLRRVRLVQAMGRHWMVWTCVAEAGRSHLGWAELTAEGFGAPEVRDMPGSTYDVAALDVDPAGPALLFFSRHARDASRLAWAPFDGRPGELSGLEYTEAGWPRGGVCGLAATPQAGGCELVLARFFSLERIRADDPRQPHPWRGPDHLAGIGTEGRLLAVLLAGALVAMSTLVVISGVVLMLARPPRIPEHAAPPYSVSSELPPAPLWLRAAAFTLDLLIATPALVAAAEWAGGTSDVRELHRLAAMYPGHTYLLFCAVYLPYDLGCELLLGGSLGKLLFGLRVVDLAGAPASSRARLVRSLAKGIDMAMLIGALPLLVSPLHQRFGDILVVTLVMLIGALPMLVTPLHQRFGDIWAATLVAVREPEDDEEE